MKTSWKVNLVLAIVVLTLGVGSVCFGEASRTPLYYRAWQGTYGILDIAETPNDVYFVDSGNTARGGDTSGFGGNPDTPFLTIDFAIGQCTAGQNDTIYVLPGHAETVIAAAGVAVDVAGISIIGVGTGDNRPTVTFTTDVAADLDVDSDDVTLANLIFVNGIDSQTAMIDVNADDFTIEDCEFREGAAAQALTYIDINGGGANACDRARVVNCRFDQTAAGGNQAIELGEVADQVSIVNCLIDGDWTNAGIHNPTAKVMTNLTIRDCIVGNLQTGDHAIELVSACTGFAIDNRLNGDTAGTILDPGSLKCLGNLEVAGVDSQGIATPVTVADSASNFIGADNSNNAAATTSVVANVDGTVLERQEYGLTLAGSVFTITETVTSSAIPNNTQTLAVTSASSGGDLLVEAITINTDGTGLAAPTNIEFSSDNAKGVTGADGPIAVEIIASFGVNATVVVIKDATSHTLPYVLESGKTLFIHGDDGVGTGAGTADVTIVFRRMAAGATITAAP